MLNYQIIKILRYHLKHFLKRYSFILKYIYLKYIKNYTL